MRDGELADRLGNLMYTLDERWRTGVLGIATAPYGALREALGISREQSPGLVTWRDIMKIAIGLDGAAGDGPEFLCMERNADTIKAHLSLEPVAPGTRIRFTDRPDAGFTWDGDAWQPSGMPPVR